MERGQKGVLMVLLGLLGGAGGCEQHPGGWTPVMEETSTAFLETETGRLLDQIRTAREYLVTDPGRVETALTEAESSIERLLDYYLPLLQARERAYNAYRAFFLDEHGRVVLELDRIGEILEVMAEDAQGGRLQEIQSLGEAVADARLAMEADSGQEAVALEGLARRINQAALKGDLILRR